MSGKSLTSTPIAGALIALLWGMSGPASAVFFVQCPGDADGDAVIDAADDPNNPHYPGLSYHYPSDVRCMHLAAGDGFITMADGRPLYTFGFNDVTGSLQPGIDGDLAANFPAPTIAVDEGDVFYLSLSNVGTTMRPDLFDPHTVHWHGFPNAATIFDGLPESAIAINAGATLTYWYKVVEPGTYMYHCHVEATEHMQMGMLGNLYVRPAQNRLPDGTALGTHTHSNPDYNADRNQDDPLVGDKYVYNDGDGSTRYDVEYAIQLGSMDHKFHELHLGVQPLPFADMFDTYAMLNGRGYPDTVNPNPLPSPVDDTGASLNGGVQSQRIDTLVQAQAGERVLLRLSNLNVTVYQTIASTLPMRVVGKGNSIYRGGGQLTGPDLYYDTHSITIGGGEAWDVIIDTAGVAPGTYFLYTTNLNLLSNYQQDFGGMMTEIVIEPAPV